MRYPAIGTLLAACILAAHPLAQSQAPKPSFEAASVKRLILTGPSDFVLPNVTRGDTFHMPSVTVADLIQFAYDIQDYRLVGGPDWVRKDLFEVRAKAVNGALQEQTQLMVQSLLEGRFRLVVHTEQREMSHFVMTLARDDGQLGPTIQPTEDCWSPFRPPPPPMFTGGSIGSCGSMSALADLSRRYMGTPVIDKTGLTGTFGFVMYLSAKESRALGPSSPPDAPAPDPRLLSLTEALRSQLGFKLERVQGPLDVFVIDSVQQPTEN